MRRRRECFVDAGDSDYAIRAKRRSVTKLTPSHRELLRKVPYLEPLAPAEFERLAARCRAQLLPKDAAAFVEGQLPIGLFVIVSGHVKVVKASAAGREQVLHAEGPGATLGEVPVFDGNGYVASAIALEDTELIFVPRDALLSELVRSPAAMTAVIMVLARRVRAFAALAESLALRGVTGRLARLLLDEHQRLQAEWVDLPQTRDELASRIGTVREQASRALAELRRRGVVTLDGRRVRLVDLAALEAVAAGAQRMRVKA